MKKILLLFATALLSMLVMAQVPAFPGAEGHGRYTRGGRGGKIVHVNNLNDSGEGSFRQAVSGSETKTVVFDVGGVIPLDSDITIGANTTILGQTAPAPGITLRYYTLLYGGDNIIVRFIRSRRGQEKNVNEGADATWTRWKTNLIIDHCSFSWSIDEVASFYDNNNSTIQWCTIGESLVNAGHEKGSHGYGGIWGGKLASFHHNLILHVANRSPRFNGARYNWTGFTDNKLYSQYQWQNAVQAENVDFRNCVVYNSNGCYGGPGGGQINMVGNYYKSGPSASIDRLTTVSIGNSGNANGYESFWGMTSRYYLEGNKINGIDAGWDKMRYDSDVPSFNGERYTKDASHYYGTNLNYTLIDGVDCLPIKLDAAAPSGEITTHDATIAFDKVLEYAGASQYRDTVDARYVMETGKGTATYTGSVTNQQGLIDVVADCEGYTEASFPIGRHPIGYDTDNDGIPDTWETANGLNSNDASDAVTYTLDNKGWYTNIEVYANSLVEGLVKLQNSNAVDYVDEYYPIIIKTAGGDYYGGTEDVCISGDVNRDGRVNVTDVVLVIDFILHKNPAEFDMLAADVNNDGKITITDAVMVIDAILGKITLGNLSNE